MIGHFGICDSDVPSPPPKKTGRFNVIKTPKVFCLTFGGMSFSGDRKACRTVSGLVRAGFGRRAPAVCFPCRDALRNFLYVIRNRAARLRPARQRAARPSCRSAARGTSARPRRTRRRRPSAGSSKRPTAGPADRSARKSRENRPLSAARRSERSTIASGKGSSACARGTTWS